VNYEEPKVASDTIRLLMSKDVIILTVINKMTFDGATTDLMQEAVRDALIAFMAELPKPPKAEATKEAQKASISAAKGDERKYLGRKPSYSQETLSLVTDLLSQGSGTSEVARSAGLSRQAVLRIKADPAAAQEALSRWPN
jgi:putative DNA-invertase from lambdoid prophage Rac